MVEKRLRRSLEALRALRGAYGAVEKVEKRLRRSLEALRALRIIAPLGASKPSKPSQPQHSCLSQPRQRRTLNRSKAASQPRQRRISTAAKLPLSTAPKAHLNRSEAASAPAAPFLQILRSWILRIFQVLNKSNDSYIQRLTIIIHLFINISRNKSNIVCSIQLTSQFPT